MKKRVIQGHLFGITLLAMAFTALGVQDANVISIFTTDGLPPQRGEQVAKDYAIDFPNQRYEIDGVCKHDSENAMCWKPDGSPNPELTSAITKAIQSMSDDGYRTWNMTFGKKRRVVFFKETRYNRNNGVGSRYGSILHPSYSSPKFAEGWTQSGSPFNYASSTGFDGATTSWQTFEGIFEKGTKDFPLRYMFQDSKVKTTSHPFKVGARIDVDGNVFEVTSIANHPKQKPQAGLPTGFLSNYPQKEPITDIMVKIVEIKNPFSTATIHIGDENGNVYEYVDEKGNSVSQDTVNKWYQKHPNNDPRVKQEPFPYFPGGYFSLDAMYSRENSTAGLMSYLPKDKVKTLVVRANTRDIYVFDHIALDPK